MRRVAAVCAGPVIALIFAIATTELEFGGSNSLFLAPVVGAAATFVLYPDNPTAPSETYGVAIGTAFASWCVAFMGWLIWMAQYMPD